MESSNEIGLDLNTATRRHCSAEAVGVLGMLGKYTDGLRETGGLLSDGVYCLAASWLRLPLGGGKYRRRCLPLEGAMTGHG